MPDERLHNKENTDDVLQTEEVKFRIESKEDLIRHLVMNIQRTRKDASQDRGNRRNINASYESVMKDIDNIQAWVKEAYHFFKNTGSQAVSLSYASEWVLDNFYIINQAVRQIKEDLTAGFYHDLPKLADGQLRGYPRTYAIAKNTLAYQNLLFDSVAIEQIMIDLQKDIPLKIYEL